MNSGGARAPAALASALRGFEWRFEDKGDFHHWVELFNLFDAVFEQHVAPRADLRLADAHAALAAAAQPLEADVLEQVCRAIAVVLDNCSNRHLFVSADYVGLLLAADERRVRVAALEALVVLARRPMDAARQFSRWRPSAELAVRLEALTAGYGGKQLGREMLACVREGEGGLAAPLPEEPSALRFQYYGEQAHAVSVPPTSGWSTVARHAHNPCGDTTTWTPECWHTTCGNL